MANPHNLKVGQELWLVRQGWRASDRRAHAVTVTAVGRKWATISGSRDTRIDLETLLAGSQFDQARCYLSRTAYEACQVRFRAWDSLRKLVRDKDTAPAHLSTEDIEVIRRSIECAKEFPQPTPKGQEENHE